jgi:hypothetical protein
MMNFNLKPDDKRVGVVDSDGVITTHPELDLFGNPFEWRNATRKRVKGTNYIVVVPPNKDSNDLVVTVSEDVKAAKLITKKQDEAVG